MKMTILIRDDLEPGFAALAAAHASLATYLQFQDSPEVEEWISGPFSKAVCQVSSQQFEEAKAYPDHLVITESALDGQEVALGFKPREDWPKPFRYYSLYR